MRWPLNKDAKVADAVVAVAGSAPAALVAYVLTVFVAILMFIVLATVGIFLLGNAWDTTLIFSFLAAAAYVWAVFRCLLPPPFLWLLAKLIPDASNRAWERLAKRDP